jgi:hypothetical protein
LDHSIEDIKIEKTWYYVIIQNPGSPSEQFVGFNDGESTDKFLPAFKTKEQAIACFALMPKDLFNGEYDTQAVIGEDLLAVANDNKHKVYLLDEKGTILSYLN